MLKFLCIIFAAFLISPSAALSKSLALIIGNDTYENVIPLKKARSDAAGYDALFAQQGFDVTLRTDLSGRDMVFELSTFFDRIKPGDTVVFVFAGHGWSDGTENFLVPTDMRASGSETLLARESFALRNGVNGIIDEIAKRGAGLTVAIVDACRDNPFATQDGTRSVGIARGLTPLKAPTGTFVAFSAGAGQTALDRLSNADPEPYSVFTRHFLKELSKPQDLQTAFKRTQRLVNEEAGRVGHPQRPAYYDEVIGSACLSGSCNEVITPTTGVAIQTEQPAARLNDLPGEAANAWQVFKDSNSIDALRLFAEQYEGTAYAALARERIASLTAPEAETKPPALPKPTSTAPRPSWCRDAKTPTERAICANDQLSQYDLRMARVYTSRRRTLSGTARAAFVAAQRKWLRHRNTCGANKSCLSSAYRARLAAIGR